MMISICIATHRRPAQLRTLLGDLALQTRLPEQVIVVDNDRHGSGLAPIDDARAIGMPFPISYAIEPEKNVSLARNHTIRLADGDWLAFIDDDERAPPSWLQILAAAAATHSADGVLGPVKPLVPADAPAWLHRGRFYHWPRMRTGTVVPLNQLRFGNVLLSAALLRTQKPVFDPAYGLTGGEDGDLLTRLVQAGGRIVWCDQAALTEPVEKSRLSLRWLLLRALRGGQDFARHKLAGRYGPVTFRRRMGLLLRAFTQAFAALGVSMVSWPFGTHVGARWLIKAAANIGKISAFVGVHYREYR